MQSFKDANLPQPLYHRLEEMGFVTPTPIQVQAIPPALEGRDILGSAQTGTGKTAAFGIPLATQLLTVPRGNALVLLPTRELAAQVLGELKKFTGKGIKTALLIGGTGMPQQCTALRAQPRLVVGTPGRINDHLERGTLMLHTTNFLVLDEVDRMLDMGFGVQLDRIARFLTAKRQTLMFSATLPNNIKALSSKYLTDPVRVSVGEMHVPVEQVSQENIRFSNDNEKYPRLLKELKERGGSILIFIKTKRGADRMAGKLRKSGHKAEALHGDLRQSQRNRITADFREMKFRILVATDVAARGLDIPHIEHVFNYDLPRNPEDYIHRIGRTARAGAEGDAVNFIGPEDNGRWKDIVRLLNPDAKEYGSSNKPKRNRNRKNKPYKGKGDNYNQGGGSRSFTKDGETSSSGGEERKERDGERKDHKPYKNKHRKGNPGHRNKYRGDSNSENKNRDGENRGNKPKYKGNRDNDGNREGGSGNENRSGGGGKPRYKGDRDNDGNREGGSGNENRSGGGNRPRYKGNRDNDGNREGGSGNENRGSGDKPRFKGNRNKGKFNPNKNRGGKPSGSHSQKRDN